MPIKVCSTWILAFSLLSSSTPAWATQHVVDRSTMRQAITDQKADRAADQAAVQALLDRQATRELAAGLGLDLRRADRALAAMSSDQLAELAASARAVNVDLAGGQSMTIVISTTTVLLILILIVLLVD